MFAICVFIRNEDRYCKLRVYRQEPSLENSLNHQTTNVYLKWTVFIKYLLIKLSVDLQSTQCFGLLVGTLINLLC